MGTPVVRCELDCCTLTVALGVISVIGVIGVISHWQMKVLSCSSRGKIFD